ncbi:hypothetical protein ACOMHN_008520 [Nucella lapillus]
MRSSSSHSRFDCAFPSEEPVSALQSEAPYALPMAEMTPLPSTENTKSTSRRTRDLHIKQAELVSILLDLSDKNGSSTSAIRDALSRKHGGETIAMSSIRQALQRAVRAGDIQLNSANYRFKLNPNKFNELSGLNRCQKKKRGKRKGSRGRKRSRGRKKKNKKKGKSRRRRRRRSRKGKGKKGKGKGKGRRRRRRRKKGKKGKKGAKKKAPKADADPPPEAPPAEAYDRDY